MSWTPLTESELHELVVLAEQRMTESQRGLWRVMQIVPQKWEQDPWGHEGGGFWCVAVIGKLVLWYNDIEDGFNISRYKTWGIIEEYWCNHDQLEFAVQNLWQLISNRQPQ